MNMFDALASSPYAGNIITRSDHMPSRLERYADWARKFYGGGMHAFHRCGHAFRQFLLTPGLEREQQRQR